MKINFRPTAAQLVAGTYTFERPANAIPFQASSNLFTVPGCPGVLFKEVSSIAEIEDLGGGIAYFSANGEGLVAAIGASAQDNFLPANFPALGANLGYTYYYAAADRDLPPCPMTVQSSLIRTLGAEYNTFAIDQGWEYLLTGRATPEYLRTTPAATIYSEKNGQVWAYTGAPYPGPYAFYNLHRIDKVTSLACPHDTAATVVYPRICAVVTSATAGVLYRTSAIRTYGWMSTLAPFSSLKAAMLGAVNDIIADAPDDVAQHAMPAYLDLVAEGTFTDAPLKLGICTYFGHPNQPELADPIVGLPTHVPQLIKIWSNGGTSTAQRYERTLGVAVPKLGSAFMPCHMNVHQVPLPDHLADKVGAYHRLALAAAVDGKIQPLGLGGLAAGSWDHYVNVLELFEDRKTALATIVASGTPTDPALLATFNPSLSQDEDFSWYLDAVMDVTDLACGDFRPRIKAAVARLFGRIEQRIKS